MGFPSGIVEVDDTARDTHPQIYWPHDRPHYGEAGMNVGRTFLSARLGRANAGGRTVGLLQRFPLCSGRSVDIALTGMRDDCPKV